MRWGVEHIKLECGSYMIKERRLAEEAVVISPVWPTKQETDFQYSGLLKGILAQYPGQIKTLLAVTHNHTSAQEVVALQKQFGNSVATDPGSLIGMNSPHYQSLLPECKYLPYVLKAKHAIPYAIRRSQENIKNAGMQVVTAMYQEGLCRIKR